MRDDVTPQNVPPLRHPPLNHIGPIVQFEIGNYKNFTYLVVTPQKRAFVVDPQRDVGPWVEFIERNGLTLEGCLLTHSHWDHVGGIAETARRFMVPIWVHPLEEHRLFREPRFIQRHVKFLSPEIPFVLGDGWTMEILHTPGHSAGEVCFFVHDESHRHLLSGDTVFVGDCGRTDLETGDAQALYHSLQKLRLLPEDTFIWPGHHYGPHPFSTLGREIAESKVFLCRSFEEFDVL